jgi:hypothetical protein
MIPDPATLVLSVTWDECRREDIPADEFNLTLSLFAADGESPLGTQLAISRKKKPKRRSTGVVNIDLDVRFYEAYLY